MYKIQKGNLLIAEPQMTDKAFFKSVVLITYHSVEESIGFVLNQATSIQLNELLDDIRIADFPVYIGGPVERSSIHYIHTLGKQIKNARHIIDDVYWGGDFTQIKHLMEAKEINKRDIRFFAGYAGWKANQLTSELVEKNWIINTADKDSCMNYNEGNKLWRDFIKADNKYAIWSNMPYNPSLN
mgnify:CR=1 FL=1